MQYRLFVSFSIKPCFDVLDSLHMNHNEYRCYSSCRQFHRLDKVVIVEPQKQILKKFKKLDDQVSISGEIIHWLIGEYSNFLPSIQLIGFDIINFARQLAIENSLQPRKYPLPLSFWYSVGDSKPLHIDLYNIITAGCSSCDSLIDSDFRDTLVYTHLASSGIFSDNKELEANWKNYSTDPEIGIVVVLQLAAQFNLLR